MARPPLSLKKIRHEPFKSRVLFHTTYSEYFKQNVKMFDPLSMPNSRSIYHPKGCSLSDGTACTLHELKDGGRKWHMSSNGLRVAGEHHMRLLPPVRWISTLNRYRHQKPCAPDLATLQGRFAPEELKGAKNSGGVGMMADAHDTTERPRGS